ncbi:MAG: tetratricopeptide repeat protein [Gammaproteobacteria bacterium]|nr:tetratricopeptide repeat protein [Gammaproteobacteria bacterium]
MDLPTSFLIYATLFRLAVIAAGVLIIVLGYRLFLQGLAAAEKSDTALEGGGFKLSVKNAAPGTSFALFGAVLISVMVVQGSPELVIDDLDRGAVAGQPEAGNRLRLRGGDGADLANPDHSRLRQAAVAASAQLLQAGLQKETQNDPALALEAYRLALTMPTLVEQQAVSPLNQMAWVYLQQGESGLALPLAQLAQQLEPRNTMVMDTLARIHLQLGQLDQAQALVDRVLKMDPGNGDAAATAALLKQQSPLP